MQDEQWETHLISTLKNTSLHQKEILTSVIEYLTTLSPSDLKAIDKDTDRGVVRNVKCDSIGEIRVPRRRR